MAADATLAGSPVDQSSPFPNQTWAIFLVSVLGLFLEMMLIRWISTEIRIFAYLQNTVLVVCFLGLGMGCFTCRQPIVIRQSLLALLALTLILSLPVSREAVGDISGLLSTLSDLPIWFHAISTDPWQTVARVSVGLAMTAVLMILLWEIFLPLGRLLGRLMDDHPNTIWAYSANVAGSLLGIWLYVVVSMLWLPPVVWGLLVALLMLSFLGRGKERLINLAVLTVVVAGMWLAGREEDSLEVVWSPYQKLVLYEIDEKQPWPPGQYLVTVNNASYQGMMDLSEEGRQRDPRIPRQLHGLSQYDIPLLLHPKPDRVLIVGAGSGNDVAGALRGGAKEITAVEIDPGIIKMGQERHPERPYDSPRVRLVEDDARSFFATTGERYDLIIFGLLDSHTTTAMTNARLDHYVYTLEALQRARTLLADGGVMVLSFEAFKPYIADRMASSVRQVFDQEPLIFRDPGSGGGWGGLLFVAGDETAIRGSLKNNERLARLIAKWQAEYPPPITYTTAITTDDWPYLYLENRQIPTLYYLLALLMLGLLVFCKYRLKAPGLRLAWTRSHWHFFFLGAAFMLLEVQNISKASVVLGNTWLVNAVIVSGIMLMILLANLLAATLPRIPTPLLTLGLIGSCVGLYFFDISQLAFLPYLAKAVLVGAMTTLPMLFSGLIFISSFARVERKDQALGANLIGALVGGVLQSITFISGIKALLLIVALLYLVALLSSDRSAPAPR